MLNSVFEITAGKHLFCATFVASELTRIILIFNSCSRHTWSMQTIPD